MSTGSGPAGSSCMGTRRRRQRGANGAWISRFKSTRSRRPVFDPDSGEIAEERFSADRESLDRWAGTSNAGLADYFEPRLDGLVASRGAGQSVVSHDTTRWVDVRSTTTRQNTRTRSSGNGSMRPLDQRFRDSASSGRPPLILRSLVRVQPGPSNPRRCEKRSRFRPRASETARSPQRTKNPKVA